MLGCANVQIPDVQMIFIYTSEPMHSKFAHLHI